MERQRRSASTGQSGDDDRDRRRRTNSANVLCSSLAPPTYLNTRTPTAFNEGAALFGWFDPRDSVRQLDAVTHHAPVGRAARVNRLVAAEAERSIFHEPDDTPASLGGATVLPRHGDLTTETMRAGVGYTKVHARRLVRRPPIIGPTPRA